VNRAHEGTVDVFEGLAESATLLDTRGPGLHVPETRLEARLQPLPELTSGLAGERHGGDVVHRGGARRHQGDHAVDEFRRLSRSRTGLHQQAGIQSVLDPAPGRSIREGKGDDLGLAHLGRFNPRD
jgi:hypothetical protein